MKKVAQSILIFLILTIGNSNAAINFTYTNTTAINYTIPDAVLNSNNFVIPADGDIIMSSITLTFAINKTFMSDNGSLSINTTRFGPRLTDLPNQRVYYIDPNGTAAVEYAVDASTAFANTVVNISTFKQRNHNLPFFSDLSIMTLNIDDIRNTWSSDIELFDEFIKNGRDVDEVNRIILTLDSLGDSGAITQYLPPGEYLLMVTNSIDPKKIITWNFIKVMPFSSSIVLTALDQDLNVTITLNLSAPADNYTYATAIINRSDYIDNIGRINITCNPCTTLAQATTINGTTLYNVDDISDIIPMSSATRTTTNTSSVTLTLNTSNLTSGNYIINTVVFNSTNLSVAFNQSSITLSHTPASTPVTTITTPSPTSTPTPQPKPSVEVFLKSFYDSHLPDTDRYAYIHITISNKLNEYGFDGNAGFIENWLREIYSDNPSPIPSHTPTPTPVSTPVSHSPLEIEPTLTPFVTPTPTPAPTPTYTPTPSPTPTPVSTPVSTPSSSPTPNIVPVSVFDTDRDGTINKSEAIRSVVAYFNNLIDKQTVINVILAYFE